MPRSICARGRAITNDWRRSMARSIVGNSATNGSDQRPIVRSVTAPDDRSYDQSWRPTTDCTLNRGVQRPIVLSIVAPDGRSWHLTTDRTINRWAQRSIARPIVRNIGLRPIVRSIVASCDRSYELSCDCRSAITHNWWCHHARLVVQPRNTCLRPLTICNSRLEVLNMTIDLVTTEFLPWRSPTTSATSRAFILQFIHDSNIFRSQPGRNLVVSPVWLGLYFWEETDSMQYRPSNTNHFDKSRFRSSRPRLNVRLVH